jgi:hypothetical protein
MWLLRTFPQAGGPYPRADEEVSFNILAVSLSQVLIEGTRPLTVVLDDGTSFTGYYSGECYSGRSNDYAIDFELQSQAFRDEQDKEKIDEMAISHEHVFMFELKDVKTITFHLKP